jgi:hypothetical protein
LFQGGNDFRKVLFVHCDKVAEKRKSARLFYSFFILRRITYPGGPGLGFFPRLILVFLFQSNASQAASVFLMAIQAANLTTAAATIFAALVFAAVKAFFLLFFAEVVHGLFFHFKISILPL